MAVTQGPEPAPATPAPTWIDLPTADRHSLAALGARVDLPPELMTYCQLEQRQAKVVPGPVWLFSAWLVPVLVARRAPGPDDLICRFVEIKACLGPAALITTQGPVCRARRLLATLIPEGEALAHGRPGTVLVTLVERIGEAYVDAHAARAGEGGSAGGRGSRTRRLAEARLLGHAVAHGEAIERLVRVGRRWLDAGDVERLGSAAARVARLGEMGAPTAADPALREAVGREDD